MIGIDVVSDTVCPWCYIGKRRLERALAARPNYRFQIGWRPFQLNPDLPADGMDRARYLALKFGGRDRAGQIYDRVREAGVGEAIAFDFEAIEAQPNTFASHRLVRWAGEAGLQDALVEDLFQRYFLYGEDIGDHEVLLASAGRTGLDRARVADRLTSGEDVDVVRQEEQTARRIGVTGVPCFIVAGKYAVSGAQEPAVLVNMFDLAMGEARGPAPVHPAEGAAGDD